MIFMHDHVASETYDETGDYRRAFEWRDTLEESPSTSYHTTEVSRIFPHAPERGAWACLRYQAHNFAATVRWRPYFSVLYNRRRFMAWQWLSPATIIQGRHPLAYVCHRRTGMTFSKLYSTSRNIPARRFFSTSTYQPNVPITDTPT
jgi:hypothetical protein